MTRYQQLKRTFPWDLLDDHFFRDAWNEYCFEGDRRDFDGELEYEFAQDYLERNFPEAFTAWYECEMA